MAETISRKMTELLLKSALLSKERLQEAVAQMEEGGRSLRSVLLESHMVDEKDWMALVSQEFGIPSLNLSKYKIDPEIVKLIPEEIARKNQVIGISKLGDTLVVAVMEPPDVMVLDDLRRVCGCKVELVLVSEKDLRKALERYYGDSSQKLTHMIEEAEKHPEDEVLLVETKKEEAFLIEEGAKEGPIIRLVDTLITEGLKRRASDIHLEPYEGEVRMRYRVDGRLQSANILPKNIQNAVIARLKLMAGVDITESRVPQDGRFKIRYQNREIDFRISILPISYGGKIVMRILDRGNLSSGLGQLGFESDGLKKLEAALAKPFGMILITGPTGSGKTTTLYAMLSGLNVPERNIITVEDPVEYQLDGITQIQVKPEIGLTFANGLRAMLRQSPDVVMVGEIRDFETADIAIKASLTGQMVLSTLHTNDAAGALTRLIDMGVEPFLIASSLSLVAAQRLCRKICPNCKEAIGPNLEQAKRMGFDPQVLKGQTLYRGKGCQYCQETGYRGRIALGEVLVADDRIREKIINKTSADEIRNEAVEKQSMRVLREEGLLKCFQGITTLEEVTQITAQE